ncbi:hypothetical protein L6452_15727 [Arctium lappa]|uniref:Uncharacterized protein n=1 Tax=Arctium lappa TaxID=4217 RepID=A0ACB9CPP2_ARCLA|nr:hypothetical protein L6452_15727 [Arctium lappa]
MGCCLTTTAAGDDHPHHKPRGGPPSPEEEKVKEVLSETPIIISKKPPLNNQHILHPLQQFKPKNDVVLLTNNPIQEKASEVSSEMYTCSESFSAATTTTTTTTTSFATDLKRRENGTGIGIGIDEDGEVTQKVKKRPPAKKVPRKQPPPPTSSGERAGRRERRIGPPAKRSAIPSTVDKKIQLPSRNITTAQHRRNIVRREPPARRSRSPAIRGEEGQLRKVEERSPVSKSGDRVPVNVTENKGKLKLKKTTDGGVVPEPEPEICESLENPLVSLECFIFL